MRRIGAVVGVALLMILPMVGVIGIILAISSTRKRR